MILFFSVLFLVLVGVAAHSRGRSAFGWIMMSLFITPFMALLFILVLGRPNSQNYLE
jgi:hypothetical protein